jgi:hypothetical protein
MYRDKRKSQRRPIRYTAKLAFGPGETHACVVSNISNTGARIDMENAKSAPDQFVLFLSFNGAARRLCRVIWREPHRIGVNFETQLTAADSTTPGSEPAADAEAAKGEPAESA